MDTADTSDRLDRAIALHEAGRTKEAEALYNEILALEPDQADALNLLGLILQNRGDLDAAIGLADRALAADPDFPEALTNRARAYQASGRFAEAAADAMRAMELDPELADAAVILCRARVVLGDSEGALAPGRQAVALAPHSFDAHFFLGIALENLQYWKEAIAAFEAALAIQPHNTPIKAKIAMALTSSGETEKAIALAREVYAAAPDEPGSMFVLGRTLQLGKEIAESIELLQRGLEMMPDSADGWTMQGLNHATLGHFGEAEVCYRRAIELRPDSMEARRALARMGRLDNRQTEIVDLTDILNDKTARLWDRSVAGFSLGTIHDKAGAFDDAFESYAAANRCARELCIVQGVTNRMEDLRTDVNSRIAYFTPERLAIGRAKGNPSEVPVFIVGMPRSGTTLVEQIVASHTRVHGVGETKDLWDLYQRLDQRHPGRHPLLWEAAAIREETEAFLAGLRAVGGEASRVVDKLPDNVAHVGHLGLLFPNARVILCYRDVRDIGLSCFFQHFESSNAWSFDLHDCGERTREIYRLMDHWQKVRPVRMLKVAYEELVGDLEGQSRRLIDFLGLEWDPACLDFHKTEREVFSASQWQVRQPLYSSSVGRWRHYQRHLQPLLDGLGEYAPADR